MRKHAYLIVANANFNVVKICLEMIDDVRNDIFLLFDAKSNVSFEQKEVFEKCINFSKIQILDDMKINWAGYSQIHAVLNLISAANQFDDYEYLHFMQGSDIPIKSQDEIHKYFSENCGYQFVQIEKNRSEMAQRKAWYRHYFCHNRFFRKNNFVKFLNFSIVSIQKFLHIKKNDDLDLYQGSALFSITGECAQFIQLMSGNIYKRFRFSLAADEVFLQTVLMNSKYKDKIKNISDDVSSNARLIDRKRPDGKNSPHIWRSDELQYILSQPESICFARKFDENVDLKIVEDIYININERNHKRDDE